MPEPREKNILVTIAERIKELRGDMTQKEFAAMLDVSPQAVSEWENANKMPRIGIIEKLSAIYGVTKSYILGDDKVPEVIITGQKNLNAKTIPIIDSIERNSEEFESLTPEEITEIAKQMEFMIQYVKNKRNTR